MDKTAFANSTTTGSRSSNEDFEHIFVTSNHIAVLMMDGHDGSKFAHTFGSQFSAGLDKLLATFAPDEDPMKLIESIQCLFDEIIELIDKMFMVSCGGSTFSFGLFQKITRQFITFQLGDSTIFLANPFTGELINALKVFAQDKMIPDKDPDLGYGSCITPVHDFTNDGEIEMFKKVCAENGKTLAVFQRTDAAAAENRFMAKINGQLIPEPSRTLEHRTWYNKYTLSCIKNAHRTPEISSGKLVISQLPFALFAMVSSQRWLSHLMKHWLKL